MLVMKNKIYLSSLSRYIIFIMRGIFKLYYIRYYIYYILTNLFPYGRGVPKENTPDFHIFYNRFDKKN